MINLFSDNVAPVPPAIMAALEAANRVSAMPYGADETTARATDALSAFFERPVVVAPVPTGTAANALAMAVLCRPYGAVFATDCAHIHTSEGGATEFFTGGAKIVTLPAPDGRLAPDALDEALGKGGKGLRFRSQPDAISLTNATELGTVYSCEAVAALAAVARRHGVRVHMDGARFANALARLGCTPAELTWRAGVDVLSLGLTKNGAMAVDAVVCFDQAFADDLAHRARRCGFTFSKMRFAAAQIVASVEGGAARTLAARANAAAADLAAGLARLPGVAILQPVEINHIFLRVPVAAAEALPQHGLRIGHRGGGLIRIVTSWATSDAMVAGAVAAFAAALDATA
ncbi:MAG: low specificity L-threonine aldolase, partial [Alphaproteobacteria bacterium]|nr:low specificity L-threonine aldolase [Alphaproteobacteria bacterium]